MDASLVPTATQVLRHMIPPNAVIGCNTFASWAFSNTFESLQLSHAGIAARCVQQLHMKPRHYAITATQYATQCGSNVITRCCCRNSILARRKRHVPGSRPLGWTFCSGSTCCYWSWTPDSRCSSRTGPTALARSSRWFLDIRFGRAAASWTHTTTITMLRHLRRAIVCFCWFLISQAGVPC